MGLLAVTLTVGLASCGSSGGSSDGGNGGGGGPATAEVQATIKKQFGEIYGTDNGGAKFDKITFEFGPTKVGAKGEHQVEYGSANPNVWPVRTVVKMVVTYSNNPTKDETTFGEKQDETFFFYKDSFGDWTFKTGQ